MLPDEEAKRTWRHHSHRRRNQRTSDANMLYQLIYTDYSGELYTIWLLFYEKDY